MSLKVVNLTRLQHFQLCFVKRLTDCCHDGTERNDSALRAFEKKSYVSSIIRILIIASRGVRCRTISKRNLVEALLAAADE